MIKQAVTDGLTFTTGLLIFLIQLLLWRIAFTLIAAVIVLVLAFGGGFAYGIAASAGLNSTMAGLLGVLGLLASITCLGAIAGYYDYDSPRVNVSFSKTAKKE